MTGVHSLRPECGGVKGTLSFKIMLVLGYCQWVTIRVNAIAWHLLIIVNVQYI